MNELTRHFAQMLKAGGDERMRVSLKVIFWNNPRKEYSAEYSDQGGHYEADSNSDLRVFGPSVAENVVNTSARSCQLRSLDKFQALRQACGDGRFQAIASDSDIIIKLVPH